MNSQVTSNEPVHCRSCGAALVADGVDVTRVFLCANCGAQFRLVGQWPESNTSRKAILSFIFGLSSVFCFFFSGIPAFVLGVSALDDFRRVNYLRGRWLAIVGATLGGFMSLAIFAVPALIVRYVSDDMAESAVREVSPDDGVSLLSPLAKWRWLHPVDGRDPQLDDSDFHETFYRKDFDDSAWNTADESIGAVYGYGDDDVIVDIGTPPDEQRHTAYFRTRFTTTARYEQLLLTCTCDDGMIVYLDGNEVARLNVDDGPESFTQQAVTALGGDAESDVVGVGLHSPLDAGEHVLAISVHNANPSSTDLRLGNVQLYGIR